MGPSPFAMILCDGDPKHRMAFIQVHRWWVPQNMTFDPLFMANEIIKIYLLDSTPGPIGGKRLLIGRLIAATATAA